MTHTTKQIKRMISKIHPTKEEVEKMSEYEWGFLVLPVKSFNLGRLDALKEEVERRNKRIDWLQNQIREFNEEYGNQSSEQRGMFVDGKLTIFKYWESQEYLELASIQEEIKLIEGAI